MNGSEITLGSIGISILLSIALRMLYGTFEIANRWKPWIAVLLGMMLSALAMWVYAPAPITKVMIATFLVQGFMTGATATGLYEMTKTGK